MLNKKAQISEVITWVVATLVIIITMLAFIYASSLFAQKTKILKVNKLNTALGKNINWIGDKTSLVYSQSSPQQKAIINKWEKGA